MLELSSLSVRYGKVDAVKDISLKAEPGEAVALIGANGAGKSSILKAILGIAPATGAIRVGGADLAGLPTHGRVARGVALSPEGRHVFPQMTVLENLAMGLTPGVEFAITRVAPLGDPVEISLRGFAMSLRKAEAALLSVEKLQ